jgi:hypothetical protein
MRVSQINLRAELRLALLAAAESCWMYAILVTVGTIAGLPREVSPLGIFIVYWVALLAGRLLPRLPHAWRLLQLLTVLVAFFAILIAIRVGLYGDRSVTDLSWLPLYLSRLVTFFERVSAEVLSTVILVLAFVRGLGFAQRPLTLWVVGFQFRLGIVVFFGLAVLGALAARVEFTVWIFAYFAFYLLSIALARVEDAGQLGKLGFKWAGVMLAMLLVVLATGYAGTRLLTLDAVNALFAFFSPLIIVLQIILVAIALPFLYLLDWVFRALLPLLSMLAGILTRLFPQQSDTNPGTSAVLENLMQGLVNLTPYLRLLGVIVVLLLVAWWIARALNKRMGRIEDEMIAREAMTERELFERETPRVPRVRPTRREIHAESVRRIYAALQAQAEALGLGRREAETPNEYLPRLAARFPEFGGDLTTITNAYVAVHYAQQDATEAQVRELRSIWDRVRARMRQEPRPARAR